MMKAILVGVLALVMTTGVVAANEFQDGDFESPTNWVAGEEWQAGTDATGTWYYGMFSALDGWERTNVGGIDGVYAQNLRDLQDATADKALLQAIAMPADGDYTLSMEYIMQDSNGMLWLSVYGMNAGQKMGLEWGGAFETAATLVDESLSDGFGWGGPDPDPDWRNFSTDITLAGQADYLVLVVWGSGTVTTAGVAPLRGVDNVDLVPEPATMSLLGLGGLALIRRRR